MAELWSAPDGSAWLVLTWIVSNYFSYQIGRRSWVLGERDLAKFRALNAIDVALFNLRSTPSIHIFWKETYEGVARAVLAYCGHIGDVARVNLIGTLESYSRIDRDLHAQAKTEASKLLSEMRVICNERNGVWFH